MCIYIYIYIYIYIHTYMARETYVSLVLLIVKISRSHSDTQHSVGLLWTCDQPVAETSTWQHITLYKRLTSMPKAEFEPQILARELPQDHPLHRADTGIGPVYVQWGMLQRTLFINIIRMLQRTHARRNAFGRRSTRVPMTCRTFPLWLERRSSSLLSFVRFSY
jgi:hypothetical protein